MYALAVFDFDGTLVDTRAPIAASVNAALAGAGLPPRAMEQILPLVGLGLESVLRQLAGPEVPDATVAAMAERYREHFATVAQGRTRPFAGVSRMLEGLRDAGLALAIATSRAQASLAPLLEEHGLADFFAFRITAPEVPRTKPHPDMLVRTLAHFGVAPGEAVMIGDTTYDLRMGRAAGTATCGVTYGSHSRAELAREEPTHLADSAGELARVLAGARGARPA